MLKNLSKEKHSVTLSVIIPCFNEEKTLEKCVLNVLDIADENLALEIIIVDDCSTDKSSIVAKNLKEQYKEISVFSLDVNQGKGAALREGFKKANGDYVAVQDADLEYDPRDLKKLLIPLRNNDADVVFGSRFLSQGAHRVLYFWHYLGNRFLTFLSNMFTDMNLTDMETCYKVFRRDIIQKIDIKENRFGFEPEIVAKVAQMRLRIYEVGISYHGRTYEEGKKIGYKDGIRAIYCIIRYNVHKAPLPIKVLSYLFVGGLSAVVNFFIFILLLSNGWSISLSAPSAFIIAAGLNYFLCVLLIFRHKVKWNSIIEIILFITVVALGAGLDLFITKWFFQLGFSPQVSKVIATGVVFVFNFSGRNFLIFPEKSSGPWK